MQDRVPVNPGRVLITPENGSAAFYATMARADNPTQEGTPLNKANLLKDATAAQFGLGADAVPDDVLSWIGKYNTHWWSRQKQVQKYVGELVATTAVVKACAYNSSRTLYRSDSFTVNPDTGEVTLDNPEEVTMTYNAYDNLIRKKYVTNMITDPTAVYYVPNIAPKRGSSDGIYFEAGKIQQVTTKTEVGLAPDEYVNSSDRLAYPDSGEVDGYVYEYLGIPFQNAVTAPKIATGSYTGTGVFGASNPNSLTFDFAPKLVIVHGGNYYLVAVYSQGKATAVYLGVYNTCWLTWDENTLSWQGESAEYQLNLSNVVYSYIAIG